MCVRLALLLALFLACANCVGVPKPNTQRKNQLQVFKDFSPATGGDDVKYNAVSRVVQSVKKQISDGDPTLIPLRELRRIFFETLVSPLHKFENEYNEILSTFVLLRNKFKEYLDCFIEFDDWCTRFIELKTIPGPDNDPYQHCIKLISVLMQHVDRMENVINEILKRDELEKRLNIIQRIFAQEHMKLQDIEERQRTDHKNSWWSTFFGTLDLPVGGMQESKDQLFKLEKYLLDFGSSFQVFKTHLKLVRTHLTEAQQALEIEVRANQEVGSSKEEFAHTLEFLWEANAKSYSTLKTIAEPDTSEIVVQLPLAKEKALL